MKIVTSEGVWIQNKDAKVIYQYTFTTPFSLKYVEDYWDYHLYKERCGQKFDVYDPYKFFLVTDKDEIDLLMSEKFDWILDYDTVKDLSKLELLDFYYKTYANWQEMELGKENTKYFANYGEWLARIKLSEVQDVIILRECEAVGIDEYLKHKMRHNEPLNDFDKDYNNQLLGASHMKLPDGIICNPMDQVEISEVEHKKLIKKYNIVTT